MRKFGKYLAVFQLSAWHALKNTKALIGLSLFLITCLVIFAHILKIAVAKTGAVNLPADRLLWYIAFNEWLLAATPDVQDNIEQDLHTGRLAYLLPRPISYIGATFAEAMGTLIVNLMVLGMVMFFFTWYQVGHFPFHPIGFLLTLIFGLAAGCLAVLINILIGLTAFWLHEVTPVHWIYEKLLFMLGGLMLPLMVYPLWMQTIASKTPFPAILGDRSLLALDLNLEQIFSLTGSLIIWGLITVAALTLLYRRGLRILNIEGG